MSTAIYICPTCGCPDLLMPESALVLTAEQRNASCPNCGWKGSLKQASGILTSERVYDTKAIAQLLFYVTAKHAAGPLAQVLALIGLIDPKDQEGLDMIMRRVCGAVVEAAFSAAGERALELKQKQVDCSACRGQKRLRKTDEGEIIFGEGEDCPLCAGTGKRES